MAPLCFLGVSISLWVFLPIQAPQDAGGAATTASPAAVAPTVVSRVTPIAEQDTGDDATAKRSRAADDHYRLAIWCQDRGHLERMREQAHEAIALAHDHPGARALLGHAQIDGRWLPSDPAALRQYVVDLQSEVNGRFAELVDPDRARREAAKRALLCIATREKMPEIAAQAERLLSEATTYYSALDSAARSAANSAGRPRGILELRLTNSKLTGMRNRSVGTGVGGPGSLQLPELSSTSIRTTTAVPLGGG